MPVKAIDYASFIPKAQEADYASFMPDRYVPPETSTLRSIGDSGIALARGALTGVKMLSDATGAGNVVSEKLKSGIDFVSEFESPARVAEKQERARLIKVADESGSTWESIKAYLGTMRDAPIDTVIEAIGTMAPTVATALIPGAGQANVARLAASAVGGLQGAGTVKGSIYDVVQEKLIEAGASQEVAKQRAIQAQDYMGANAGNIAGGIGLGVLAGGTGVEKLLTGAGASAKNFAVRGLIGAGAEAVPEGAQGGQEKYATNVALQREGFDVPTWQGVAGSFALEATASAPIGGGMAVLKGPVRPTSTPPTPTPDPAILSAPDVDSAINAAMSGNATGPIGAPLTTLNLGRQTDPLQSIISDRNIQSIADLEAANVSPSPAIQPLATGTDGSGMSEPGVGLEAALGDPRVDAGALDAGVVPDQSAGSPVSLAAASPAAVTPPTAENRRQPPKTAVQSAITEELGALMAENRLLWSDIEASIGRPMRIDDKLHQQIALRYVKRKMADDGGAAVDQRLIPVSKQPAALDTRAQAAINPIAETPNVQNPAQAPAQPGAKTQAAPAQAPETGATPAAAQSAAGTEAGSGGVQADGVAIKAARPTKGKAAQAYDQKAAQDIEAGSLQAEDAEAAGVSTQITWPAHRKWVFSQAPKMTLREFQLALKGRHGMAGPEVDAYFASNKGGSESAPTPQAAKPAPNSQPQGAPGVQIPITQTSPRQETPDTQETPVAQAATPSQPTQGKQVSFYPGKYGKGMNRDAARLESTRLNRTSADKTITYAAEEHGQNLENPYAVVGRKIAPAQAAPTPVAIKTVAPEAPPNAAQQRADFAAAEIRRKAPGVAARARAHAANPFKAFLGNHGVSNSLASEFVPGPTERRAALVQGYGPIFRGSGQQLDILAQRAVEEGFLIEPDADKLYAMITAVLRGKRIIAQYAEGVVEDEMQTRIAEAEALAADAPTETLEALDQDSDIPWTTQSNASDEDFLSAMGATDQEIENEAASQEPTASDQALALALKKLPQAKRKEVLRKELDKRKTAKG